MPLYESPALILAGFGDEKTWRKDWRLWNHYHVCHIVRSIEYTKGKLPTSERFALAKKYFKAVAEHNFGTSSYIVYMNQKRAAFKALRESLNSTPDFMIGETPLFKVYD